MKRKGLLLFFIGLLGLSACGNEKGTVAENDGFGANAVKLSFKSASSYEYLTTLKDQEVTINGYWATSSPIDGSFAFLMNMPYQSCPFCKPNTTELSNTIEVYPKDTKFEFGSSIPTGAVKVVGVLKVAEDINQPFTDKYNYKFNFKIVDADFRILKDSDLSSELALWQKFANTSLVTDLYQMFDYLDFVCKWPTYYINTTTKADGTVVRGFYLWPGDALDFLKENAQYGYGNVDGYFDKFITRLNKLSTTGFEPLIKIINDSKTLADYALSELENEHYTAEDQYMEKFGYTDKVFKLNDTTLETRCDDIYGAFADWLSSFEM